MLSGRTAVAILFVLSQAAFLSGQPRDPNVASTDPLPPEEQVRKFHLPPGFAIQLVAAEPKIKKPINIAFDAMGRLWVTGSEEYPFPAAPGREPKDKLVILEDFASDGRARKSTVFADGLNIPIGVLPMPDCKSAIVFSIPNIWKLTDTDGDGKADKKEVLYSGYGYKDTHGMTGEFMWGFDGWIYCCHGFANASNVRSKGETKINMQSGNTYRIKPDGSKIEQFTWGQVNPFGLAFDPLGNLYSTDCHTRPLYQLLKGAYYPSFGKPHDGLGFGPEMINHDHGSTALCGIAYYAADHYPKEFHDNLFIGNVITNRINRDRLEWRGSSPKAIEMPDFVKCDDPWFRPVDIKLGPDGCLYVADFYNRIIGHYEVPLNHPGRDREKGRIWRIVYVGEDGRGKPKEYRPMPGRTVEELVEALGDPNLSVQVMAINELVVRGPAVLRSVRPALIKSPPPSQAGALWVIHRLGDLSNQDVRHALAEGERLFHVHAMKVLAEQIRQNSEFGRNSGQEFARESIRDKDRFVMRAAAEALAAAPEFRNIEALSQALARIQTDDTHLHHMLRIALRQQLLDPPVMKQALQGKFTSKDASLGPLLDVCLGVPSSDAAKFLLSFGSLTTDVRTTERRFHHIARYGDTATRAKLLEDFPQGGRGVTMGCVKAFVQASQERGMQLKDEERSWAVGRVLRGLTASSKRELGESIELAAALRISVAEEPLLRIVEEADNAEAHRKSAVAALVTIEPKNHVNSLARLLLDDAEKIGVREQIASSLASVNQSEAYTALVQAFEKSPARLQTTIGLGMASSPQGGTRLLDAVAAGKASARLLQDRAIEQRLRQAKIGNLDERLAKLTKGLPPADQKALELIAQRRKGFASAQPDVKQGRLLFEKHCAACHIVANQGSKIGPQLDGIGIRGLERLLEDTLDPSRNVDQAFRATTIELDNGQFVSGLLLREEGKVLVLADNQGKEVRIEGSKVANRTVGQLSPMPANFAEQIMERDFHHLMAYLLEQRAK
jgi:putative heme-binding domain-containing protein